MLGQYKCFCCQQFTLSRDLAVNLGGYMPHVPWMCLLDLHKCILYSKLKGIHLVISWSLKKYFSIILNNFFEIPYIYIYIYILYIYILNYLKKKLYGDFPGGSVIKTLHSQYRGLISGHFTCHSDDPVCSSEDLTCHS